MKKYLLISIALLANCFSAQAAFFLVDRFEDAPDTIPGDGFCVGQNMVGDTCSLRAAIMEANATPGADTIGVPNGTYVLSYLNQLQSDEYEGDLDITDEVSIVNASEGFTIDGNGTNRIFQIHTGGNLTLINATLTNGVANTETIFQGGAIKVEIDGSLSTNEVIFVNNLANRGGALFNDGTVVIENSYFHHNAVTDENIPINLDSVGSAILNRYILLFATSTVSHNGELLSNPSNAPMTAAQYALHFNPNGNNADAPVSFIFNSTISDNGTGGIRSDRGITDINQSTIANHEVYGIRFHRNENIQYQDQLQLKFRKSLIVNNGFQDCNDPWVYPVTEVDLIDNFNASTDDTCGFTGNDDYENLEDPINGSLHHWGGFAPTLMLKHDSLAVDHASDDCTDQDQRNEDRPLDGNNNNVSTCDMGALEFNPDTDPMYSDSIFKNSFDPMF
ncbi:MAG: choice-of-anchor Q domain-containing protein [Marinicella sp.]